MAMLGPFRAPPVPRRRASLALSRNGIKTIELSLSRDARLLYAAVSVTATSPMLSFLPIILICNSQLRPAMTPPSTGKIVPVIQLL